MITNGKVKTVFHFFIKPFSMTLSVVLFWLRIGLSVAAGLWLGLKISPLVRKLVTRLTPMRQRLRENFLRRLGLMAGSLSMLMAGSAAVLLFLGLGALGMGARPLSKKGEVHPGQRVSKTVRSLSFDTQRAESVVPLPPPLPSVAPASAIADCYLQVGAFDLRSNAEHCAQSWRGRVPHNVIIGQAPVPPAPYKVLIGPFDSFEAVRNFRAQQGIDGFSRPGSGLKPLH